MEAEDIEAQHTQVAVTGHQVDLQRLHDSDSEAAVPSHQPQASGTTGTLGVGVVCEQVLFQRLYECSQCAWRGARHKINDHARKRHGGKATLSELSEAARRKKRSAEALENQTCLDGQRQPEKRKVGAANRCTDGLLRLRFASARSHTLGCTQNAKRLAKTLSEYIVAPHSDD